MAWVSALVAMIKVSRPCACISGLGWVEVDWTVAGCKLREIFHQNHNLEGADCLLLPLQAGSASVTLVPCSRWWEPPEINPERPSNHAVNRRAYTKES